MKNWFRRRATGKYLPPERRASPNELKNFFYPCFWSVSDPDKVVETMRTASSLVAGGYHFADNLFTWGRNNSMLDDAHFMKAWESNVESMADRAIIWRRYILACMAYHAVQLPGDFVECGAYTGVGVKTVVDYLGGLEFPKPFWIYDLFEHDSSMLHHSMPEHGPGLHEKVVEKFRKYEQVKVLKGEIPRVFDRGAPDSIAYLHIDMNEAPAEIAALDALFDRVVPGGVIVLDDYEWSGVYRAQKLAEDAWFEQRRHRVVPLPTGQGFVIKR